MPVLVTRPIDTIGLAVVDAMASTGGQVRAFVDPSGPVAELRAVGAICAVGDLLDEGHLESAMEQVHTVVHLTGLPLVEDPEMVVEEAATMLTAAVGAGVRRLIVLSLPAGGDGEEDALRRAAREVEEMVAEAPFPVVILRTSLIDQPEMRDALARTPMPAAALDNDVAPLKVADVAALLLRIDDRRDEDGAGVRVLGAQGPEVIPLRTHLSEVGITPMSLVGRVLDRLTPGTSLLADAMSGPWLVAAEVEDAWRATGLTARGDGDRAP